MIETYISADGTRFARGRFPAERVGRLKAQGFTLTDAPPPPAQAEKWDGRKWVLREQPPRSPPPALEDGAGAVTRAEMNALKAHLRGERRQQAVQLGRERVVKR